MLLFLQRAENNLSIAHRPATICHKAKWRIVVNNLRRDCHNQFPTQEGNNKDSASVQPTRQTELPKKEQKIVNGKILLKVFKNKRR